MRTLTWMLAVLLLTAPVAAQEIVPEPSYPRPDFASQAPTLDPSRGLILPIIELPTLDRTGKNGLRAVFADLSQPGKVQVHLVFADEDSPGRGKLLDRTYDAFRWLRYRRVMDVETLTFELDRAGKYKAVEFHGTYSGEQTWNANPPEHKTATIPYSEFKTRNGRPVVVVNTWNHLLSNSNTNPGLPVVHLSQYPVYEATRAQIKSMFERTWLRSFKRALNPRRGRVESRADPFEPYRRADVTPPPASPWQGPRWTSATGSAFDWDRAASDGLLSRVKANQVARVDLAPVMDSALDRYLELLHDSKEGRGDAARMNGQEGVINALRQLQQGSTRAVAYERAYLNAAGNLQNTVYGLTGTPPNHGATGIFADLEARATRLGGGVLVRPLGRDSDYQRTEARRSVAEGQRLLAKSAPPTDPFASYRRADGTVTWKRAIAGGAFGFGRGTLHFAFALFIKELAIVAATGDRRRIEEFFDALLTTDFYVQYGLFVAGAKVADVAYTRYLQRFVRPSFVSGVLKTNLVLATGMALPLIVEGKLDGKTFAISVASLGLSVTAVQAVASKVPGLQTIRAAQQSGTLAKVGATAGRLARIGGWVYTAVELALILYVAEEVDKAINAQVARMEAVASLVEATRQLQIATRDPNATAESVAEAVDAFRGAWIDYRNGLYAPVEAEEAFFVHRLQKLATSAKLASDERSKTLQVLARSDALRANIESRYGSIDAYADYLAGDSDGSIDQKLAQELFDYSKKRDALFAEVYEGNRRGTALLGDDPAFRQIESALANASKNRLEAYADEAELLVLYRSQLHDAGRDDLAAVLASDLSAQQRLLDADRALVAEPGRSGGLVGGMGD